MQELLKYCRGARERMSYRGRETELLLCAREDEVKYARRIKLDVCQPATNTSTLVFIFPN